MTDTKAAAIAAIDRVQRYGYATPSDYASIREHFTGKREGQLMTDTEELIERLRAQVAAL